MSNFINISDVRQNLPDLVKKVSRGEDRVVITVKGQPQAVLVSQEELESLEETAEILAIPGAEESLKEGLKQAKRSLGIPLSKLK